MSIPELIAYTLLLGCAVIAFWYVLALWLERQDQKWREENGIVIVEPIPSLEIVDNEIVKVRL